MGAAVGDERQDNQCPQCGSAIPADAPAGGLCPKCLMQEGLKGTDVTPTTPRGGFVPPTPEQLAGSFPQLEVLELVGQGGMGAVYRAKQVKLDRVVALKILTSEAARGPAFEERFTREARALARVSHPSIVAIHDFGKADEYFYFVMEYVDGANLREVMRAGSLSPEEAMAIIPQVCDALQYAHEEGVVHRDIKPENILLDRRGRAKIADFGLAKMLDPGQAGFTLTVPGQVMGTPAYMAPEQIERPSEVDHRADIFSLGVVFYEMLTGELPLGRFAPPSRKVQMDVRLDEIVLRTLEKEPDLRYQHAVEVKTDVEAIEAGTHPAPSASAASAIGAPPASTASAARPAETTPPPVSRAEPSGSRTLEIKRPRGVTWVAVYCFVMAALNWSETDLLGMPGSFMFGRGSGRMGWGLPDLHRIYWLMQPLVLALVIWYAITAVGLLRLRSWSRTHAIVLAAIGLFFFPAGTIMSIFVLAYLLRSDVTRLFELGEGPATLKEAEAQRMERTMGREPERRD